MSYAHCFLLLNITCRDRWCLNMLRLIQTLSYILFACPKVERACGWHLCDLCSMRIYAAACSARWCLRAVRARNTFAANRPHTHKSVQNSDAVIPWHQPLDQLCCFPLHIWSWLVPCTLTPLTLHGSNRLEMHIWEWAVIWERPWEMQKNKQIQSVCV